MKYVAGIAPRAGQSPGVTTTWPCLAEISTTLARSGFSHEPSRSKYSYLCDAPSREVMEMISPPLSPNLYQGVEPPGRDLHKSALPGDGFNAVNATADCAADHAKGLTPGVPVRPRSCALRPDLVKNLVTAAFVSTGQHGNGHPGNVQGRWPVFRRNDQIRLIHGRHVPCSER